jgi:hypothetical protein
VFSLVVTRAASRRIALRAMRVDTSLSAFALCCHSERALAAAAGRRRATRNLSSFLALLSSAKCFVGHGFNRDKKNAAKRLPLAVPFPRAVAFSGRLEPAQPMLLSSLAQRWTFALAFRCYPERVKRKTERPRCG